MSKENMVNNVNETTTEIGDTSNKTVSNKVKRILCQVKQQHNATGQEGFLN